MPGIADLSADEVRDALRLLNAEDAAIASGNRRVLRDQLVAPGRVTDLLDRAPEGAAEAFRRIAVDGAASVEDLLSRGWAGVGRLPEPLDWLQRRAMIIVGREGLVHATDAAREGFSTMVLDLPEEPPIDDAPLMVEAARTVLVAPNEGALDRATAVPGAALRAVSATVAVSDRSPAAVHAALESAGLTVSAATADAPQAMTLGLPGTEQEAVGPRAIRRLLEQSLEEQRQIRLEYFASSRGGQATERVVDPWTFTDDLLRGYCHLREGERTFAVDRIGRARLLSTHRTHDPVE